MADFNLVGIDLNTGQFRPIGSSDTGTDSLGNRVASNTGITGVTGIAGTTGVQGFIGMTGPVGITGFSPTGIFGETGVEQGVTGLIGRTGIYGRTGLSSQGIQGLTGSQGVYGEPGAPPAYMVIYGATTLNTTRYLIGVTGGGFIITLPSISSSVQGKRFIFFDISGTAGNTGSNIIIKGSSTQTINGSNAVAINTSYGSVEVSASNSSSFGWFARFSGQGITGIRGATGSMGATGLIGETGIAGQTGI